MSGLTGVGTGTLSSFLADRYALEYRDAGDFFRKKAAEHGMSIDEFDSEAEKIEEEKGIDFDTMWDRKALEHAFREEAILIEGRLTGVLLSDIADIRVWVRCDRRTVAERLQGRESVAETIEGMSVEEIEEYVQERNTAQLSRYSEKYGVDPTEERHYNVLIDNSRSLDAVKQELVEKVENCL